MTEKHYLLSKKSGFSLPPDMHYIRMSLLVEVPDLIKQKESIKAMSTEGENLIMYFGTGFSDDDIAKFKQLLFYSFIHVKWTGMSFTLFDDFFNYIAPEILNSNNIIVFDPLIDEINVFDARNKCITYFTHDLSISSKCDFRCDTNRNLVFDIHKIKSYNHHVSKTFFSLKFMCLQTPFLFRLMNDKFWNKS